MQCTRLFAFVCVCICVSVWRANSLTNDKKCIFPIKIQTIWAKVVASHIEVYMLLLQINECRNEYCKRHKMRFPISCFGFDYLLHLRAVECDLRLRNEEYFSDGPLSVIRH